jgi:sigma intracellular receptor 2
MFSLGSVHFYGLNCTCLGVGLVTYNAPDAIVSRLFQFPVFIFGAWSLWTGHWLTNLPGLFSHFNPFLDSRSIYLLLLIYGASTTTTTLPCLTTVLAVPTAKDAAAALKTVAVTDTQRLLLLSSYVPFLLVPLIMTLDMAWRLSKMVDIREDDHKSALARSKRKD